MQDQLEQYIVAHKEQFDVFEPEKSLWDRIDRELNGPGDKSDLAHFIVANKDQLDVFEPETRLWKRIDTQLQRETETQDLEQCIVAHKQQLDVFEPNDRLWERIDQHLGDGKDTQSDLEQFIVSNKDQLDVFEPNDQLWQRIDQELHTAKVRRMSFLAQSWKLAAAVAFLVAAGALLWWVSLQAPQSQMAGTSTNATPDPQALYTAELVEVESYYTQQISNQKAQIASFKQQGIILDEALYEQMEMLGNNYQELQSELVRTEDQDLIVNAMIQNLMMQMGLLNQQLMILEDIKTKQSQYGNQKQS